ncbi:MAG: flavin reductase [Defluviitaleaceae bacterium]|nr:flavin reductase [Defluviitaleaceae bacterium]
MHCIKKITENLLWVGANDRRLAMFEGVYSVPDGVSYNSYLLLDDKTVLFDTVDKAVASRFMENIAEGLNGRKLDYLILQHIEPDHSATVEAVLSKYPDATLVLNHKSFEFAKQFYNLDETINSGKVILVTEKTVICTGKHKFHFVMAPMVHWPEVMVTYEETTRTLFSADGFGSFGALNGAIFADEVDFKRDYMDEARRYYTNIVGKYGNQVQALLKKASGLQIDMICPLHGFVWRSDLHEIIAPYMLWSRYEPEQQGVMIAYASVYGNTENAAEILSSDLRDMGIPTVMFDVSVTPASEIIAAAFKWSHLVFASTTYNAKIFVTMEALIYDLVAHNIQNRTIALIENGTWAATSGALMRKKFEECKNITFIGENSNGANVSIRSSVKADKLAEINNLAKSIADSFPPKKEKSTAVVDVDAMWKIPYGLFLVTARDESSGKENGCIVNTVSQITVSPLQITVFINKDNLTHDMVMKTGKMAVSVLTQSTPFAVFEHFGLVSGRDKEKIFDDENFVRMENGLYAMTKYANAVMTAEVVSVTDCGTHSIFMAEITESKVLNDKPSCTYEYYFQNIKPKPQKSQGNQAGYVCKICGYIHYGESLPADFICPLCKHGVADFEKL